MEDNENKPGFNDVENEPTPFGLGSPSPSSRSRRITDIAAAKNRRLTLLLVAVIVIVCVAGGFFVVYRAQKPSSTAASASAPSPAAGTSQTLPAIAIGVRQTNNGSQLVVQWNNLPDGTDEINIFYSAQENGTYRAIGNIPVTTAANGNGAFDLPAEYQAGYFYGVASDGNGSPLWTSSSTSPTNLPSETASSSTSSPSSSPNPITGPSNGNTPPNNTSSVATTTNDNGNNSAPSSTPGTGDNGTSTASSENFLVQHVDQKIQISWQSLPAAAFQVVISRSASDAGPWTAVLTETNLATDGPYSIEVVDDTLGDPYYYEMNVYDENSDTIASYGPVFLQPL